LFLASFQTISFYANNRIHVIKEDTTTPKNGLDKRPLYKGGKQGS